MRTHNLTLDIAVTHLSGRLKQTVIAIIGVTLGVGFFVSMAAMMQGFHGHFEQTIIDVSPHIVMEDEFRERPRQAVRLKFDVERDLVILQGVKPKEEIRGIKNAESIIASLDKIQGLHVSPTLEGQVFYRYGSTDVSSNLIGIEPNREKHITTLQEDMELGRLEDLLTHNNGVVLGSGLSEDLNAEVGDTLTAVSSVGIVKKVKVVGVFHSGIVEFDNSVSYTLLKQAQILHKKTNVINVIRFALDNPKQAEELARKIEARYRYKSVSWQEANEGILSMFIIENMIMYTVTAAILIVACFGIFNIISTLINEKARDIAILKSIGFTEGDIQKIFLLQGIIIGFIGMIFGWVFGYWMTRGLEKIPIKMEDVFIDVQHFFVVYSIWHYLIGGVFCLLAASFAAWLPAKKASHLKPVDIIRGAAG
jgi:lipoprotein-releasing system permease protein